MVIGSDPPLENVPHFKYLGSRMQGDGSDEIDVGHRLGIAQSAFNSLSHLWAEHRLSRIAKPRLLLVVRRRRLHYLGHVLRMPADRMVRWALIALVMDSSQYTKGSRFSDCQGVALSQLINGNGVNLSNVTCQSGAAIMNLCFK